FRDQNPTITVTIHFCNPESRDEVREPVSNVLFCKLAKCTPLWKLIRKATAERITDYTAAQHPGDLGRRIASGNPNQLCNGRFRRCAVTYDNDVFTRECTGIFWCRNLVTEDACCRGCLLSQCGEPICARWAWCIPGSRSINYGSSFNSFFSAIRFHHMNGERLI